MQSSPSCTEQLGPEEIMVVAEIVIQRDVESSELPGVLAALRRAIRSEVPTARRIYLEPVSG